MEKFKYVLDNTIKELNRDISPKELEIKELKEAISKEDERLKHYNSANSYFEQLVHQLEIKSEEISLKINESKDKLSRFQYKLEKIKTFLSNCMGLILDYTALKNRLKEFKITLLENVNVNENIENEYEEQLGYLTQSLDLFKDNIVKGGELHKIDNRNSIKENIQLIREILKLRKEIRSFKITERIETIQMRKDKKLKNMLDDEIRNLTIQEKEEYIKKQEEEINRLKNK